MSRDSEALTPQFDETPMIMSAKFYAGYLCMVDSIASGDDEYRASSLPGQLDTVMGRALEELSLENQRVGVTRLRKIQTYLTDLVDPFGRDFAVEALGLERSHIVRIENPFVSQSIVRAIWRLNQDRRHSIRPDMLSPYVPTFSSAS